MYYSISTGLSRHKARFACRTKFRISNFEFPCMANRLINFGSRSRSNFSCASSVGLSQNARLGRTKSPVFTNWLEQSWKCSDKSALAWPEDSGTARKKSSSRKNNYRPMGPKNSKLKNRLMPGTIVFRRSRRCPKHICGSDLANRLMNTGPQSQPHGLAK